jgi:hypothetical protein
MSNAYLKRMPAGFPGDVSRKAEATVEAGLMGATVAFGAPVKMDGGKFVALSGASDAVYGFVVRPYRGLYQITTYYAALGELEFVYAETVAYADGI